MGSFMSRNPYFKTGFDVFDVTPHKIPIYPTVSPVLLINISNRISHIVASPILADYVNASVDHAINPATISNKFIYVYRCVYIIVVVVIFHCCSSILFDNI